jgi:hypothetical protein
MCWDRSVKHLVGLDRMRIQGGYASFCRVIGILRLAPWHLSHKHVA